MTNLNELWVLEWSEKGRGYHVDPLLKSISNNIDSFRFRRPNDYVPIWVGSEEEVYKASERFHAHTY